MLYHIWLHLGQVGGLCSFPVNLYGRVANRFGNCLGTFWDTDDDRSVDFGAGFYQNLETGRNYCLEKETVEKL